MCLENIARLSNGHFSITRIIHVTQPPHLQHQAVRTVPIQVVPMQFLTPQEPQTFIQSHGRNIALFRLQHNLIRAPVNHLVYCFPHERGCNAIVAVRRGYGEHSNVAAEGGRRVRGVRLEFADDYANKWGGICRRGIKCLLRSQNNKSVFVHGKWA